VTADLDFRRGPIIENLTHLVEVVLVPRGDRPRPRRVRHVDGEGRPVADRAPWFNHSRPVVVLMDSPHPSRVYDSTTRLANGTNADVLSDLLADLPIRIQKETIGPSWHREEEVRLFDPDWIVIHYSGFCQETCTDRTRLRQLVESFAESKTRFLIYSRSRGDSLRHGVDTLLRVVDSTHRGALRRVYTFGLRDHGGPYWRDPMTAAAFKLRFRQLLNNAK